MFNVAGPGNLRFECLIVILPKKNCLVWSHMKKLFHTYCQAYLSQYFYLNLDWWKRKYLMGSSLYTFIFFLTASLSCHKLQTVILCILCISKSCLKNYINFFTLPFDALKSFMRAFKAFIKPFEAPKRSMKIKN